MRYVEFRDLIRQALLGHPEGMTWKALREALDLPYQRPCPNWVARLEQEIGLVRRRGSGRALVWRLGVPDVGEGVESSQG